MGWAWDYSTIVTAFNMAHLREAGLKPPSELGRQVGLGRPSATTRRS